MATKNIRTTVTLLPEWEKDIDTLKKERFYNKSKSEMLRYLIQLGLDEAKKSQLGGIK